jgi:ribosomal protein L40E
VEQLNNLFQGAYLALEKGNHDGFYIATRQISQCLDAVTNQINTSIQDFNERKIAVEEVVSKTVAACEALKSSVLPAYKNELIPYFNASRGTPAFSPESNAFNAKVKQISPLYGNDYLLILDMISCLGDRVATVLGSIEAVPIWRKAWYFTHDIGDGFIGILKKEFNTISTDCLNKIKEYDISSYWEIKGMCRSCGGNLSLFGNKCKSCGHKNISSKERKRLYS